MKRAALWLTMGSGALMRAARVFLEDGAGVWR